jgi:hypothetical protein
MTNRPRQSAKETKEVEARGKEAKAQAYIATLRMLQHSMETGADVTLTSAEAAIVYRILTNRDRRVGLWKYGA